VTCPKCHAAILPGQIICPTTIPSHAPCFEHGACYTLCADQHAEADA
jgi:hypothetical protein